jgi:hypothetical protein
VLNVELGGLAQGTEYDWISVTGNAALAGTLNVNAYSGYAPPAGSTYNFLGFASKSGSFSAINYNGLAGLSLGDLPNALQLTQAALLPAPVPAPVPTPVPTPVLALVSTPIVVAEDKVEALAQQALEVQPQPKKRDEPEAEACP